MLKDSKSSWAYSRLSSLAEQRSSGAMGARAALALGFYDYNKQRYAPAATWFARAKKIRCSATTRSTGAPKPISP